MKPFKRFFVLFLTLFVSVLFLQGGCKFYVEDPNDTNSTGSQDFALNLVTLPSTQLKALYVSIAEVQVQKLGAIGDDWITLSKPNKTVNLYDSMNASPLKLVESALEVGDYTKIRFLLRDTPDSTLNVLGSDHPFNHYVVRKDNSTQALQFKNGTATEIVISQSFSVKENQDNTFILGWDLLQSLLFPGSDGKFLWNPIFVLGSKSSRVAVKGTISHADVTTNLSQAYVLVESLNPTITDLKNTVQVVAASVTDANGNYEFLLPSGVYYFVVWKDGFQMTFEKQVVDGSQTITKDFALSPSVHGQVAGTVKVSTGESNDLQLNFRPKVTIDGLQQTLELAGLHILNGGPLSVSLPAGSYEIIQSTPGKTSTTTSVEVKSETTTVFDPFL